MTPNDPIIELRQVSKAFGRQVVLDGVDLKIKPGKCTVIIGRSGTGKSVLLKHIVGLLRPDSGEVYYQGRRIDQLRESRFPSIRREIAFVFQLNALFDSMNVIDNVCFPMTQNAAGRVSRAEILALARSRLSMVGMAGFEHKRPAELSGGEKKRVALARAIAMDPPPKVILYDEPTAGLDPQRADVIDKLIRHLQSKFAVTSIVVTHDMRSAAEIGDRILMLHGGRFVADATPRELAEIADPIVRRFVDGIAEPDDLVSITG